METKYITIPFDLERAKRITNGEEDGKIVTRDGREVRIICFDVKDDKYPIVGLVKEGDNETIDIFRKNGIYSPYEKECDCDLLLLVPEWTTFKNGDIVTMGWEEKNKGEHCKWISIIKSIDFYDDVISTKEYVSVCLDTNSGNRFTVDFDSYSDAAKWIRKPTDEEVENLIGTLVKNKDSRAKEYLKRFLDIEIEGYNFHPKDWVLTRENSDDVWKLDIFSHSQWDDSEECYHYYCVGGWNYECVPYEGNEKLLGTKMGLEDLK